MMRKELTVTTIFIIVIIIHLGLFLSRKESPNPLVQNNLSKNELPEVIVKEEALLSGGDPETDHRLQIFYFETDSILSRHLSNADTQIPDARNRNPNAILLFRDLTFTSPGELFRYTFHSPTSFYNCTFIPADDYTYPGPYETAEDSIMAADQYDSLEIQKHKENYEPFQFRNLAFENVLQFTANTFRSETSFDRCRFLNQVSFKGNLYTKTSMSFFGNVFTNGLNLSGQFSDNSSFLFDEEDSLLSIAFQEDTIHGMLNLSNCYNFTDISFSKTLVDSLDLSFIQPSYSIELRYGNLDFPRQKRNWTKNRLLNFLLSPYINAYKEHKTYINLVGSDISKIDLDYTNFEVYFSNTATENERSAVYQGLLSKYGNRGEMKNYRKVDIEYHNQQGGLFNFISHLWWNYGYSKWFVFLWSFFFVLLFSFTNYRKIHLILESYKIKSVEKWLQEKYNENPYRGKHAFIASILYTGAIFFGVKLDFEKFEFNKLNYSLFILFQFLLGLVCTGFIINIIVSK